MQIFDFPEAIFWQFSEKFKQFLSRFPVNFFETVLWLGLRLNNQTTKNCNQSESSMLWGRKIIG